MKPFLDEDVLLDSPTARALYHGVAAKLPIVDYHCHISPREIAENRVFHNLAQLWLEGDHYKWRLMRANGVDERCITGDAPDEEKFAQWAATLEKAPGNPLYAWSHLELRRYFGYTGSLNGANANEVWAHCGAAIGEGLAVRDILKMSRVKLLCTTDDPVDSLAWHRQLAEQPDGHPVVLPAFRPDQAVEIGRPGFAAYLEALAQCAGMPVDGWENLTRALDSRMEHFAKHGCALADHGLDNLHFYPATPAQADAVLQKRLAGGTLTAQEEWTYKSALLLHFGRAYAKRGWAMQLHFAARRNNNTVMFRALGPDTGYDSIGDGVNIGGVAAFMDALAQEGLLPRTILYSLEPSDNPKLVTLAGCFQGGGIPGKIQHGAAWWFNDHKLGMEAQLATLANDGLLGNFLGMLTDSRSFLSYTRHEYFRRILCNLLGGWAESGELPNDRPMLEKLVSGISYSNSIRYFGWERYVQGGEDG